MENSKFSGAGFAAGTNSNSNSVLVGYESGQNRRWTLAELAAGLPTSSANLQQVMTAGSVSTVTAQTTTIKVVSLSGNYSQLTFSGSAPGESATMQTELSTGGGSSVRTGFGAASMQWSTQGVGNRTIQIGPSTFQIRDDIADKGIEYHSDYSANFSARSLVDKDYVDGLVGTAPTIQEVVNSGTNSVINDVGNNRSYIDFREGNTTSQFNLGKDPVGVFGIRVGTGNFTLQGATFQAVYLQPGVNSQKRLALIDTTSGNALTELTGSMDMKFSSTSALKCGGTASPGTSGQVLKSTGTSIEWTSVENLNFSGLPTSDPGQAGKLWNDNGTLKISTP